MMMKKLLIWMMTAVLLTGCGSTGASAADNSNKITAEDGYAEGMIGDTFATKWFDWTVNSAELTDTYGTFKESDGEKYLVVNSTIVNTFGEDIPMFANDFQVIWGDGDEDYANPINSMLDLNTQEDMFATEFTLAKGETLTGDSVFKVPADCTYFVFAFLEYMENATEGDLFAVYIDLGE